LPLKAIILAAGEGTRLRPITETRPKALIPILCKPIIRWHVEALLPLVDEVIIVVGYKSDLVVKYLETSGLNNSKIRFVKQEKLLGTGDAVLEAIKVLDPDDEAIVSYSDVFLEDWIIFENLRKISGNIVVGVRVSNPRDYGVLVVEGGVLKHIVEKPEHPESNIVNAGIYKLRVRDVIDNSNVSLSPRGEVELTSIVSKMANSSTVRVYEYSGKWIDIGKPWHVIEANKIELKTPYTLRAMCT
jgi:bifunctional UDP-N-acetylglucosamine pyrophosphorylase/glucosamine-1-phosphate N-acetyltransferase